MLTPKRRRRKVALVSRKNDSALRNVRRARTLSQMDLARLAGIDQADISRAECGRLVLRPDLQERIAAILGTPRAELFPEPERKVAV